MLTPKEIAYEVTKALDAKKGMDIKLLKIDEVSTLADYFLICTGTSNTHVRTRVYPGAAWRAHAGP